jgi:hypothetical protein
VTYVFDFAHDCYEPLGDHLNAIRSTPDRFESVPHAHAGRTTGNPRGGAIVGPELQMYLSAGCQQLGLVTVAFVLPPDAMIKGSATVLIGNKPAARMRDNTSHADSIPIRCPSVLLGG